MRMPKAPQEAWLRITGAFLRGLRLDPKEIRPGNTAFLKQAMKQLPASSGAGLPESSLSGKGLQQLAVPLVGVWISLQSHTSCKSNSPKEMAGVWMAALLSLPSLLTPVTLLSTEFSLLRVLPRGRDPGDGTGSIHPVRRQGDRRALWSKMISCHACSNYRNALIYVSIEKVEGAQNSTALRLTKPLYL